MFIRGITAIICSKHCSCGYNGTTTNEMLFSIIIFIDCSIIRPYVNTGLSQQSSAVSTVVVTIIELPQMKCYSLL